MNRVDSPGCSDARNKSQFRFFLTGLIIALGASQLLTPVAGAQQLKLERSDYFELVRGELNDTVFTFGNVRFDQGGSLLECDSAVWVKGNRIHLWGNVVVIEPGLEFRSDSAVYNLRDSTLHGIGERVVLVSQSDSIYAVGKEVYYDKTSGSLELLGRPRVEIGYPRKEARVIVADYIRYEFTDQSAIAQFDVELYQSGMSATADCAIFDTEKGRSRLYESVVVKQDNSTLAADFVIIWSKNNLIERLEAYDHAEATFSEKPISDSEIIDLVVTDTATAAEVMADSIKNPLDSALAIVIDEKLQIADSLAVDTGITDIASSLKGNYLIFDFEDGDLRNVRAYGRAYSNYSPAEPVSGKTVRNIASGDSISIYMENDTLRTLVISGSAEGTYIESRRGLIISPDTSFGATVDTIRYSAETIVFDVADSTISLSNLSFATDGQISLDADHIEYLTAERLMRAYPRDVGEDSVVVPPVSADSIPESIDEADSLISDSSVVRDRVILRDGTQEVSGSYLEYSLETHKGIIRGSYSQYQSAYYTGSELYREDEGVFYVDGGKYTSCNDDDPHFYFWSKSMKLVRGDKLIAKPVVLVIEKLPIFILPYYVFPLKKGRRSGILNFRFGDFSDGGRFLSNVGYYWAASDYWDWEGWFDYYENSGLTLNSIFRYRKRYVYSGNVSGSYAWESRFLGLNEQKTRRWQMSFNHSHTFSPTFKVGATGRFVSDSKYYTDFSNNLDDRLNRTLKSKLSFSEKLGKVALSGSFTHNKNLDDNSWSGQFPSLSLSLPSFSVLGSPEKREDKRWYHGYYTSYSATVNNFASADDRDSIFTTIDSSLAVPDTTIDTTTTRIKKNYSTIRHSSGLRTNIRIGDAININPSLSYSENWAWIWNTNLAREGGIQADKFHRTYAYSASVGMNTELYGTISPNVFGLLGLRHVFTPGVSYSYTPDITFDSSTIDAARFSGIGSGSARRQAIGFSIRNQFDGKVRSGETEKKFTILTLTSNVSYNPEATERRWSNLSTGYQTSLLGKLRMSGSMIHSFYEDGGLQSFDISTSYSASGDFGSFGGILSSDADDSQSALKRSWRFSLRHYYSESGGDLTFVKRHTANFNLNLQLTRNMSVTYSQYYDIARKLTVNRRLELRRKIHCWEAEFNWVPTGSNAGFSFRINVIDLPDIKYEKNASPIRGRGIL